jgi:hypothetical protein
MSGFLTRRYEHPLCNADHVTHRILIVQGYNGILGWADQTMGVYLLLPRLLIFLADYL